MEDQNRYQYQPWYVRLWRKRHLIPIPYRAIKTWWRALGSHSQVSFKNAWSIEHGFAHVEMEWYYTSEEMWEKWNEQSIARKNLQ